MKHVANLPVDIRGVHYEHGDLIDETIETDGKSDAEVAEERSQLDAALASLVENGKLTRLEDSDPNVSAFTIA